MYNQGCAIENETDKVISKNAVPYADPILVTEFNVEDATATLVNNEDCALVLATRTVGDSSVTYGMMRIDTTTYSTTTSLFFGMKPPRFE